MRLFVTKPSPYARKAWAAVHELGLERRCEIVELPARMPTVPKPELDAVNPLGKVPTLVTDEGRFVVDSPVIVAYLDALAGGRLIPAGDARWPVLTLESLADGCMDAGVVLRVEQLKQEERRDRDQVAAHEAKIARTLDLIEGDPAWLEGGLNAGQLALACAIDWLIFRALVADPLAGRPRLAAFAERVRARPAMAATRP
ncbi:MAG: glutathione S-transferase N-terminal domain-containing protein [Pseudomonadota bacterium]|nr:glutathione S-transferase N-terminal domain-containing protein [Pseudomonadota bacterium]